MAQDYRLDVNNAAQVCTPADPKVADAGAACGPLYSDDKGMHVAWTGYREDPKNDAEAFLKAKYQREGDKFTDDWEKRKNAPDSPLHALIEKWKDPNIADLLIPANFEESFPLPANDDKPAAAPGAETSPQPGAQPPEPAKKLGATGLRTKPSGDAAAKSDKIPYDLFVNPKDAEQAGKDYQTYFGKAKYDREDVGEFQKQSLIAKKFVEQKNPAFVALGLTAADFDLGPRQVDEALGPYTKSCLARQNEKLPKGNGTVLDRLRALNASASSQNPKLRDDEDGESRHAKNAPPSAPHADKAKAKEDSTKANADMMRALFPFRPESVKKEGPTKAEFGRGGDGAKVVFQDTTKSKITREQALEIAQPPPHNEMAYRVLHEVDAPVQEIAKGVNVAAALPQDLRDRVAATLAGLQELDPVKQASLLPIYARYSPDVAALKAACATSTNPAAAFRYTLSALSAPSPDKATLGQLMSHRRLISALAQMVYPAPAAESKTAAGPDVAQLLSQLGFSREKISEIVQKGAFPGDPASALVSFKSDPVEVYGRFYAAAETGPRAVAALPAELHAPLAQVFAEAQGRGLGQVDVRALAASPMFAALADACGASTNPRDAFAFALLVIARQGGQSLDGQSVEHAFALARACVSVTREPGEEGLLRAALPHAAEPAGAGSPLNPASILQEPAAPRVRRLNTEALDGDPTNSGEADASEPTNQRA